MNKKDEVITRTGDTETKNNEYEKILEITVCVKLNFIEHLNDIICKSICKIEGAMKLQTKVIFASTIKIDKNTANIFNCCFSQ